MRRMLLLLILALMAATPMAHAAIPHTISYQGVLKDAAGTLVPDGPYALTFSIYDTGSTLLWTETQTLPVANGIFNATMGALNPINLDFTNQYTLGIAIGGDPELVPRVQLTATGYALNAERLDGRDYTYFSPATHDHELDDLSDVDIAGATDAQVLTYKASSDTWVAEDMTAGTDDDWTVVGNEMYANVSGDIGMGVTNPAMNLHIYENSDSQIGLMIQNPNTGASSAERITFANEEGGITYIAAYDNDSPSYSSQLRVINNRANGKLVLGAGSGSVTVASTGNVGVGTISPTAKLDVNGTAKMDGFDMDTGAVAGHVLTSNGGGTGTWQAPAAVSDGDWTISGDDIYRLDGRIGIGILPDNFRGKGGRDGTRIPSTSKVRISGTDEGLYGSMSVTNGDADGRAAIYGMRSSSLNNPGTGHTYSTSNAAVSGYNSWGDSYTFGVTGFSWFDQIHTGGVLGGRYDGSVWGALGYHDANLVDWGIYTPGDAFVGGRLDAITAGNRAGNFESNYSSTGTHVIHSEYTQTGTYDATAVYGRSVPQDYWGTGGYFQGGYFGCVGNVQPTGSGNYMGVWGYVGGSSGANYGVYGQATNSGTGINVGVYGRASGGAYNYAGQFTGNVHVSGTLSKSAGSFKIDHPLDPESKYLYHSFVESPDMKNIYDGVVQLDNSGESWVELPDWFDALNGDFRYQLTCIGGYAQVYIAEEVTGNRFKIAGGSPGLKVSWQVTGIRHDAYAEKHRIPVEEYKPDHAQGTYLSPDAFGLSESRAEGYERQREIDEKNAAAGY
ncbi:MAG: hypothetical protein GY835_10855 [bacterium]|nr:hypothetical protein [bacterium]